MIVQLKTMEIRVERKKGCLNRLFDWEIIEILLLFQEKVNENDFSRTEGRKRRIILRTFYDYCWLERLFG